MNKYIIVRIKNELNDTREMPNIINVVGNKFSDTDFTNINSYISNNKKQAVKKCNILNKWYSVDSTYILYKIEEV